MSRNALVLAGLLFLLYPVLRPWDDETTAAGAHAAMSSSAWVLSHFLAIVGFVLVPLGLLGLRSVVGLTPVVVMWIGAGLTLPYYGAEDFGLHAAATEGADLLAVADAVRYNPVAVTSFGVGLVMLAVGAVLVAVAVWRSEVRYAALVFAAGFVLFLPQFFAPGPVRIAHGLLMLVGLVWFGLAAAPKKTELSSQGAA